MEHIKEAHIRCILRNWDIPQNLLIERISDTVWRVGKENRLQNYVLKSGKREWIQRNINITKALAKQGLTVGEPIIAKSGADYIDAAECWVLCRAINGEPLPMAECYGENYQKYAFMFGEAIAKLHAALASIDDDIAVDDVDLFKHITEWAFPNANVGDTLESEYINEFADICPLLPKQLIHRDTHPENILWHNRVISGFIDFDIAQRNVRLWDICYCSTALLPDCPNDMRDMWFDVLRELLRGYDKINPLTDDEKRAVYYVICSIQLTFIAWGQGQGEYKEMTRINRDNLDFIIKNKKRIIGGQYDDT